MQVLRDRAYALDIKSVYNHLACVRKKKFVVWVIQDPLVYRVMRTMATTNQELMNVLSVKVL